MFNLNSHTKLTIYTTILYLLTNTMCNNKKISYQFMKMFNIKNKIHMQIICSILFSIGFYFISIETLERFNVGVPRCNQDQRNNSP